MGRLLFCLTFFLSSLSLHALLPLTPCPPTKEFRASFFVLLKACIDHNQEIENKTEVLRIVQRLERDKSVVETGDDELRIPYVMIQGCIEHILACYQVLGKIEDLVGAIHTPTVATPCCIRVEGPFEDVLDKTIREDVSKILTVRTRAQIVRDYLAKGGKLFIVYPESGIAKRNPEQLAIYRDVLTRFSKRLFDWKLPIPAIDAQMIGATYLFQTSSGEVFAFSIKSRQANDIQKNAEWGLWFGRLSDKAVNKRVQEVCSYLKAHHGPDLHAALHR